MKERVAVVVPAAGVGRRMGEGRRKQFRLLGGQPVLVRTLETFERHLAVAALIVVGPVGEAAALEADLRAAGLSKLHAVVDGGATRQESVGHGLAALPDDTEIVLVHDAVRPFLPTDRLTAVIDAARTHGAAALAIPAADTMRRAEEETFGDTVERANLWRMQTPQAFRADLLHRAHAEANVDGTDEVELVQRLGHRVLIVEGSARTFKLTTPDDWALAEALWSVWEAEQGRGEGAL